MMLGRSLLCKTVSRIPRRTWTSLTRSAENLTIHALNDTTFPYIWLRDSCQSPGSINPATGHKLHCTSAIPFDIAPMEDESGIQVTDTGLDILWNDGRKSKYQKQWLERYASPVAEEKFHWDDTLKAQPWTRASISSLSTLSIPYQEILSEKGLVKGMEQLAKYGLLFVRGVPHEETSDERCEMKRLAELFGELRGTFYGLVWDVVKLKGGKNVAYTDLALGLHMDLLYFEHPPRYQVLHCLRNKAVGGTSIVVDGLYAAQLLRKTHPADFDILTKTPVSFHYIHDGHHVHREHFTISLAPPTPSSSHQEISQINYSPAEQAPLPLSTPKEFYPALKRFADLLNDDKHTFHFSLEEGDVVLYDNRRMVHGRTAFRDMREEEWQKSGRTKTRVGEPDRWLKGCYLQGDALLDRVRTLKTRMVIEQRHEA